MKRLIAILLCSILIIVTFTACGSQTNLPEPDPSGSVNADTPADTPDTSDTTGGQDNDNADAASWEGWGGFTSSFARSDSSQYNNATLQIKDLGDGIALFGFDIMEGSESTDRAESVNISGAFIANSDLTGTYEGINESGETIFSINFQLAKDGQKLTVTHEGDIAMNPDGTYNWLEGFIEADEGMAKALLENLPTAVTSLNSNLGAYTVNYPDSSILNYFYPVTATFDDTGAVLADFLVAGDLSSVWRLDTENGVPVLIFGEAQTMLDRVVYLEPEEGIDSEAEILPEAIPLLDVIMEDGTFLKPGTTAKLMLDSPYPFAFTIAEPLSVHDDVATVSKDGVVTAHNHGMTTISGTIVVEDGKRGFTLDITVGKEGDAFELELSSDLPYWNGLDFGPNLGYAEEYQIQSDPGDYANAAEAAKLTFDALKSGGNIPKYSDSTEYIMVLINIDDIKGEECYIYRLDDTGSNCAYAYQSGNVYYKEAGGEWKQAGA